MTEHDSDKKLEKLKNLSLAFLQVCSKGKQVQIFLDGGDFSVSAYKNIEKDKELKWLHTERKFEFQKLSVTLTALQYKIRILQEFLFKISNF